LLKVYLDTCALSRLTDEPSQERIHVEAEAVRSILNAIRLGELGWVASVVNRVEIEARPDEMQRLEGLALLAFAGELVKLERDIIDAGRVLTAQGFGSFDALHLACADKAGADALLTTDDRFIRLAARVQSVGATPVLNPVEWLQERRRWHPLNP
jgi:predicted nucleic acid-binding protein